MKLLVANHKMNLTYSNIMEYREKLDAVDHSNCDLVIIPSFLYLGVFDGVNYSIGSQNVSNKNMGSLTGEVSAEQLKSMNVKYALVAHSERRNIMKEKNFDFTEKIKRLIENNITPIFCIGESLSEKNMNLTNHILKDEIELVFNNFNSTDISKIIIAYEPIWAIGSGLTPTNSEIYSSIKLIKEIIKVDYNTDIKVLYGGSVNPNNIVNLETISNIDGYLIGGASLDFEKMLKMIGELK